MQNTQKLQGKLSGKFHAKLPGKNAKRKQMSSQNPDLRKHDLYGIGNSIMDVIVDVDEADLKRFGLQKGRFTHLSAKQHAKLDAALRHKAKAYCAGGSTSNTVALFSQLGGKAVFCGKVGRDDLGKKYHASMAGIGVKPFLAKSPRMTGRAIALITPDSDRTFAVHLGAAKELVKADVNTNELSNAKHLHVEGYLFDKPGLRNAALHAMQHAKENGLRISIDLADPGVVLRNKAAFERAIHAYTDIVFANEDEAKAITGHQDPEKALRALGRVVDIAVVKLGKHGSLILKGKRLIKIKGHLAKTVDTTGAGDAYAGAFLYALSQGYDLPEAGNLASFLAAKVVEQKGARLAAIPNYRHLLKKKARSPGSNKHTHSMRNTKQTR